MQKIKLLFLSGFLSISASNFVIADEPEDIINYREHAMGSLASNFKMMKALLTSKVNEKTHLLPIAQNLTNSAMLVKKLFPEGSDFGETSAKEAIWENPEDFQQKVKQLESSTQAFLTAVSSNQKQSILMEKYKDIGSNCKSCHKKYKEK